MFLLLIQSKEEPIPFRFCLELTSACIKKYKNSKKNTWKIKKLQDGVKAVLEMVRLMPGGAAPQNRVKSSGGLVIAVSNW